MTTLRDILGLPPETEAEARQQKVFRQQQTEFERLLGIFPQGAARAQASGSIWRLGEILHKETPHGPRRRKHVESRVIEPKQITGETK